LVAVEGFFGSAGEGIGAVAGLGVAGVVAAVAIVGYPSEAGSLEEKQFEAEQEAKAKALRQKNALAQSSQSNDENATNQGDSRNSGQNGESPEDPDKKPTSPIADPRFKSLSKEQQKSVTSLLDRINEHQAKLDAYRQDPYGNDEKGLLKDSSPEMRERIINGRITKLEKEIKTFKDNIEKELQKGE
jgi:hypothetical protein